MTRIRRWWVNRKRATINRALLAAGLPPIAGDPTTDSAWRDYLDQHAPQEPDS